MTGNLLMLGAAERKLYSEDFGDEYRSNISLENLEFRTEQVLGALNRGEKPYKSISRQEMKNGFGDYDGYTDFNDVYVVDGLSRRGEAFTAAHEYIHKETGMGSNRESEVLDLTYKVLRNIAESDHVDSDVRKLARKGFNYGKLHKSKFYDIYKGLRERVAFQPAAEGGNQEREPIDEIVPYIWRGPLRAVDYVARFPRTFIGNLLSLGGPKDKKYNISQEAGISNIGKSITNSYQKWINRVRSEERERRKQAEQQAKGD